MNLNDIIKQAKEAGTDLRVGDATDLQLANDHEYRMKQLELANERDEKIATAQMEEARAKQAQAQSQQELIKTIAVAVGQQLLSKHDTKDVKDSSDSVKKLAGAVQ
jgi:membrane-bound ClpP family serine protease